MKKLPKDKTLLAAEIAQLYLLSDPPMTQQSIAKQLKIDKATVSRLYHFARERELIKVSLNLPREQSLELSLIRKFGLTEARVLPVMRPRSKKEHGHFRRQLAQAAVHYLEGEGSPLKHGQRVAISCGRTIREVIDALTPNWYTGMKISQLTVETEVQWLIESSPFTLVGMLRGKWNDVESEPSAVPNDDPDVHALQPLPGTLLDETNGVSTAYRPEREKMRSMALKADVALVGISSCNFEEGGGTFVRILAHHRIPPDELRERGVVGEICNRPYDDHGNDRFDEIPKLSSIMDGIRLEDLRYLVENGKKVVAIAGGVHKVRAIKVALGHKFINYLVTDTTTAELILR